MLSRSEAPEDLPLGRLLIKKAGKSQSGVLVITVLTSPYPKVSLVDEQSATLQLRTPTRARTLTHAHTCTHTHTKVGDKVQRYSCEHARAHTRTAHTHTHTKVGDKVQRFSCDWNCYYCPNEPGQPRSYLHDEPSGRW